MIKITRSKFNVDKDKSKRTHNGIVFDSVLEMEYYRDVLCPAVESGDVVSYELQKPYELQPKFRHDGKSVQPIKYAILFQDGGFVYAKNFKKIANGVYLCPDVFEMFGRENTSMAYLLN